MIIYQLFEYISSKSTNVKLIKNLNHYNATKFHFFKFNLKHFLLKILVIMVFLNILIK